jgi:hypothetical protein
VKLAIPMTDRIARLAQSFVELKERVRDAVATEMGKVVADAVRDWITSELISRRPRSQYTERDEESRYDDGWDDKPDGWEYAEPIAVPEPESVEPRTQSSRWAAALSIGVVAFRWLIGRRLPMVPSLGVGVLAGLCTVAGGPLVQSLLAASTAAADLVGIARPEPHPSF